MIGLEIVGLAFLVGMAALYFEQERRGMAVALSGFGAIHGLFHLLVSSPVNAAWLALGLFSAIGAGSRIKYGLVNSTLMPRDIRFHFPVTMRTLWSDFRPALIFSLAVIALCFVAIIALVLRGTGDAQRFTWRLVWCAATLGVFAVIVESLMGRSTLAPRIFEDNRRHISNFLISLWGRGPEYNITIADAGSTALPLHSAVPPRLQDMPDIYLILHESTFDPRVLNLPLPDELVSFFEQKRALHGKLGVNITGGSTWQSEFALYCGLSSRSFGANAAFVFQLLYDRIFHALPLTLRKRGYLNLLISSDSTPEHSHERFYRAIGFDTIAYPQDELPLDAQPRWHQQRHDHDTFAAALQVLDRTTDNAPRFLSIMTYLNHGNHEPRRFAPELHVELRNSMIEKTGSRHFAEYMVRLKEQAAAYEKFKQEIASRAGSRGALIIRYGDHLPNFVVHMPQANGQSLRETFYSIEALNLELAWPDGVPRDINIALLASAAMAAAGLGLDEIDATRLSLASELGLRYAEVESPRRSAFHRALIELNLIRV